MFLKQQIANFFTLLNLVSGMLGILFILKGDLTTACLLVFAGAFFDLLDGMVARALGITSEIGKQLDSFSDMVTFGVVPGLIAYTLLTQSAPPFPILSNKQLIPILIPVFSAMRLAKFNLDTRQSKDFIGMPTPANGLLWASLGFSLHTAQHITHPESFILMYHHVLSMLTTNPNFIISLVVFTSLMLVAPLRMFGFKFDKLQWKGNELKFILLAIAILSFTLLRISAIPFIIVLYIIFSILQNLFFKRHEIQS